MSSPHQRLKANELRALIHALREPVGSFVIRLALLDDEELSDGAQEHIDAMLSSVQRMIGALTEMTSRFELDRGESTPLAILSQERISQL